MASIIDSKGQELEIFNYRNRSFSHVVILSLPSIPATAFSAAVIGKREASISTSEKQAFKFVTHQVKQFNAFDVEIIAIDKNLIWRRIYG